MIWTLRIECISGRFLEDDCVRVIEIDAEASLCDLHDAIQEAVDFDWDHLFGFYLANSPFAGRQWLCSDEDYEDAYDEFERTPINSIWPLGRKKFYYLFDYGDDWIFQIKKPRTKPQEPAPGVGYPRVVEAIGPNPPQYGRYDDDFEDE